MVREDFRVFEQFLGGFNTEQQLNKPRKVIVESALDNAVIA